jgi:hypothetical protein
MIQIDPRQCKPKLLSNFKHRGDACSHVPRPTILWEMGSRCARMLLQSSNPGQAVSIIIPFIIILVQLRSVGLKIKGAVVSCAMLMLDTRTQSHGLHRRYHPNAYTPQKQSLLVFRKKQMKQVQERKSLLLRTPIVSRVMRRRTRCLSGVRRSLRKMCVVEQQRLLMSSYKLVVVSQCRYRSKGNVPGGYLVQVANIILRYPKLCLRIRVSDHPPVLPLNSAV